jgi:hypothetical protein
VSIEAHKCNQKGCNGFVVFENADFDIKNPDTIRGLYAYDNPTCNVCGKEFLVVPHYVVIDVIDHDLGEYDQLESACMSDVERKHR